MTLPDSETERMAIKSSERYPQYPNGDKSLNQDINAHRKQKAFVEGAYYEAFLWYERMGKFAEWVVDNGWKRVNFIYKDIKWYNTEQRRQASHAELIELFINSLNEGK